MARFVPAITLGQFLVLAVLLFIAPNFMNSRLLAFAISWTIFACLVLGVDLVHGSIGYLSLAHAGLWGVSSYTLMALQVHEGFSFWPAAGAAIVFTVVVAAIIASFSFRTTGYYFAIVTFAVAELIRLCFINFDGVTGGHAGIFLFDRPSLLGIHFKTPEEFYRGGVVCVFICMAFVWLVKRTSFGRTTEAVGQNEDLARALGINSYISKSGIFVLSAVPTAISGILFATYSQAIEPSLFGSGISIGTVLMAILGGTGYLVGPLIGATIYVFTPEVLPFSPVIGSGVLGFLLIVMIRVSPDGMAPRFAAIPGAAVDAARWANKTLRPERSETPQ